MKLPVNIPTHVYKILLLLAAMIWGFSFVVMKDVVEVFPPAWLLGIRFVAAGVILLMCLWKRVRSQISAKLIGAGIVLGALDFGGFFTQTVGLQTISPGVNAFLTATYCVIVPFLWWLLARRKPTWANIGAAIIAIVGIWLVSVTDAGTHFALGFGEGMTLLCAVFFALHMVYVSKFSRFYDVLVLTVIQFITEGCLGLVMGASTEAFPAFDLITLSVIGQMAFLVVFASIIAFGIQNVSLAFVPPAQASLILCLESVFGVLFSVLLYGEVLTLRLLIGFGLIFVAILMSEGIFSRKKAKD